MATLGRPLQGSRYPARIFPRKNAAIQVEGVAVRGYLPRPAIGARLTRRFWHLEP
jgi:hypothetical protein